MAPPPGSKVPIPPKAGPKALAVAGGAKLE